MTIQTGLQTFRCRITGHEQMAMWAEVELKDYPDHPIRLDYALLYKWDVPVDVDTDFWMRGNVIGTGPKAVIFREHPETAMGVGEGP